MTSKIATRRFAITASQITMLVGVTALSGCLGPTYGTGKSQAQMLFDDLNSVATLGTVGDSEPIAYTDREQVRIPENTSVLPPPQARSPQQLTPREQRRRVQQAAYSGDGAVPAAEMNRRNPYADQDYLDRTRGDGYDFERAQNRDEAGVMSPEELQSRSALFRQRQAENQNAARNQRSFLSEPPLQYRRPAEGAPVGDPGVDEAVKQRRMQGTESLFSKARDYLPF